MPWQNIPILAYHKISNQIGWGITCVSVRFFYEQMHYLHRNQYQTISVDEFDGNNLSLDKTSKKILITFDDADVSVYQNAFPIMKKFGFVGTIFVITDFIGKPDTWDAKPIGKNSSQMNWEQIKQLYENGWSIGSHTVSHRNLVFLPESELRNELIHSKKTIENKLKTNVSAISYPFNRFNRRVIQAALTAGYDKGFALGTTKIMDKNLQNMVIPRLGVYLTDPLCSFKKKVMGTKYQFFKQNIISKFSIGSVLWNRIFSKSN